MEKLIQTQITELLEKSQKPLIVLPSRPSGDALGSGLGLALFLKALGKKVQVCAENFNSEHYSFLPGFDVLTSNPEFVKTLVVSISTSETKLRELSYGTNENSIEVFLKPTSGEFKSEDVTLRSGPSDYDLVICLNVQSLEQVGEIYTRNTEVFFNTPILNIDNSILNAKYGALAVVDLTAASNAENIYAVMKMHKEEAIDADVATCLLTGILSATHSFQDSRTTPQAFFTASELVTKGANQPEIVRHLFKTKRFSVLKLWGRAMARLTTLPLPGVMYTGVNLQDIERSGSSISEAEDVLKELSVNISDLRMLFLAYEKAGGIDVYVYTNPNLKITEVLNQFSGKQLSETTGVFALDNVQMSAAEGIIQNSLESLKQRLGL